MEVLATEDSIRLLPKSFEAFLQQIIVILSNSSLRRVFDRIRHTLPCQDFKEYRRVLGLKDLLYLMLTVLDESGRHSKFLLYAHLQSKLCLKCSPEVMHRTIDQFVNDLFALFSAQVLDALEPLNHLLTVRIDLFFDIVEDDRQTSLDLLKLLDVDVTVVVQRYATSQIEHFFHGNLLLLATKLLPFKCI